MKYDVGFVGFKTTTYEVYQTVTVEAPEGTPIEELKALAQKCLKADSWVDGNEDDVYGAPDVDAIALHEVVVDYEVVYSGNEWLRD